MVQYVSFCIFFFFFFNQNYSMSNCTSRIYQAKHVFKDHEDGTQVSYLNFESMPIFFFFFFF